MHYRICCFLRPSLFKPLFIVGAGLLFFSQSSDAADEFTPLMSERTNERKAEFEKEEHVHQLSIPDVVVPDSLLKDLDYEPAQAAISKIIQYLAYVSDEEYIPGIIEELHKEGIGIEGCDDIENFLLERALTAATDRLLETSLQGYLGALRNKNLDLQEVVKKFQAQVEAQGQKITQQQKENSELISKLVEKEEENKQLLSKLMQQQEENGNLRSALLEKEEENKPLLLDLTKQKAGSRILRLRYNKPLQIKEENDLPLSRIDQEEKSTNWFCFF